MRVPSIAIPERWADVVLDMHSAAGAAQRSDWDGEGAQPVSPATSQNALMFIHWLSVLRPEAHNDPCVTIDSDGWVTFSWANGNDRRVIVAVDASGDLRFAAAFPGDTGIPESLVLALRKLGQSGGD
jgi:hypothetical protein